MASDTPVQANPSYAQEGEGEGGMQPPFFGYIETTKDALLVFEAARRGMVPRVTRRLMETEKQHMIKSGAVFIFDSSESGIRRWTDGMEWSPSRILGNFLVYREQSKTEKRGAASASPLLTSPTEAQQPQRVGQPLSISPPAPSTSLPVDSSLFGQGELRPRSPDDSNKVDKQRERQLVGSLTNSTKFKQGGLVKKTLSVAHGDVTQHLISYYTIDDVISGKLRSPTNLPEMSAIDISPDYLMKQNFRFPLQTETGIDGVMRYRGEPHGSRYAKSMKETAGFIPNADMYYSGSMPRPESGYANRSRPIPIPMASPISPTTTMGSYVPPGSAGSMGWFGDSMSPVEQSYVRPGADLHHAHPGSSRGTRYTFYNHTSPRSNSLSVQHQHPQHQQRQHRRPSVAQQGAVPRRTSQSCENQYGPGQYGLNQPGPSQHGLSQSASSQHGLPRPGPSQPSTGPPGSNGYEYDVKPVRGTDGNFYYPDYSYGTMSPQHPYLTSPPPPLNTSSSYSSQYTGWRPLSSHAQAESSRMNDHVPRQVTAMTPSLDYTQIRPGLNTASSTSIPSNASPSTVFQAPPAPVAQGWPQQSAPHMWDPEEYPQGPSQYQPPPASAQQAQQPDITQQQDPVDPQHYQMSASSQEWRDGVNGMASS